MRADCAVGVDEKVWNCFRSSSQEVEADEGVVMSGINRKMRKSHEVSGFMIVRMKSK